MKKLRSLLLVLVAVLLCAGSLHAQLLLTGAGGAGGAASPVVTFSDFTATDGGGTSFNQSTISVNVTGLNPMLLMCGQVEFAFGGGNKLFWYATYNGVLGSNFFNTDGYAEPGTLVCYYWVGSNLATGTHDLVTTFGERSTPSAGSQEMTVAVLLLNNAAQITYPFRGTQKDISASMRSSETETCTSAVGDLVIHVMATSLFTPGTPGAGETIIVNAQDGTDDASLLITRKAGAATSTTVSSSGWAGTFPLQGLCMSIMPAGTAEPLTIFSDTFNYGPEDPISHGGLWTKPAGATVGNVKVASNIAQGSGAIEDVALVAASFAAGQQSTGVIAAGAAGGFTRLWVRCSNSGGYMLTFSSAATAQLFSVPNSGLVFTYNQIGSDILLPFNFASGDLIGIQVSGDTIKSYWGGLEFDSRAGGGAFSSGGPCIGSFGAIPIISRFFASTLPVRN